MITTEAHAQARHPVRDYLDQLVWDGTPRLNSWLTTYGGADSTDLTSVVGAIVLIAAVRRVRQPGCKYDALLILEAPQGTRKSTAIRTLCPDETWFSDDLPLGADSKSVIERSTGRWIIEASELVGSRGREVEALKAFLSRQVDGPVRLAYARLPVSVPRQFVSIGTTNQLTSYLKDSTGGRRFWPVRIASFDVPALFRDRDQLWAEAAAREASGESIYLAESYWAAAAHEQELRRAVDPWEPMIEALIDELEDGAPLSVETIWTTLGSDAHHLDGRHADRVAQIVQRHGFVEKKKFRAERGATPKWHWLRGSVPSCSEAACRVTLGLFVPETQPFQPFQPSF